MKRNKSMLGFSAWPFAMTIGNWVCLHSNLDKFSLARAIQAPMAPCMIVRKWWRWIQANRRQKCRHFASVQMFHTHIHPAHKCPTKQKHHNRRHNANTRSLASGDGRLICTWLAYNLPCLLLSTLVSLSLLLSTPVCSYPSSLACSCLFYPAVPFCCVSWFLGAAYHPSFCLSSLSILMLFSDAAMFPRQE